MAQYDGYYMDFNTGEVVLYRKSGLSKIQSDDIFRVDKDKVAFFEANCRTLKSIFMDTGWLRLHMPINYDQEILGTTFLCVPPPHRARVLNVIQGGTLVTTDIFASNSFDMRNFIVMETGMHVSITDIVGIGELIDLKHYRTWLIANCSNSDEIKQQMEIAVSTKFFLIQHTVEGMFINRRKNWIEKVVS
jgi:hypothetical protein